MEEYFKILWTQLISCHQTQQEVQFGKKNITTTEVFCQNTEWLKAANCDEIDLNCLKTCVSSGLAFWKGTEQWQIGVIIHLHKRKCNKHWYYPHYPIHPGKVYVSVFKNDVIRYLNVRWRIISVVIILILKICENAIYTCLSRQKKI